uniref:3'-5' exonuclease n=1 Tax=Anopheles culicifacies TaxID=139723 RepID=A0A182MT58_9DIPT
MSLRKLPLWARSAINSEQNDQTTTSTDMHDCTKKLIVETPLWARSAINSKQNDQTTTSTDEPPKKRLRSNYAFPTEEKKEPNVQIEYLPLIDYTGVIEYYTTLPDMAFCCDQLMEMVVQQSSTTDQDIPIAFDLEWPVSFKTGPGRTALMQLCATPDRCILLQVSCLKRLPAALLELLYHPRVVLHGVNIKNDFHKLARDFPEVDADRLIARYVDLSQWYNQLNGFTVRWSLARLVEKVLKQRICKDKRVRMSQWNVLPLSAEQKLYAAIDVYIGQELYLNLAEKQRQQENVDNHIPEEGDAAVDLKNVHQQTADVAQETLSNCNNNPKL